MNNTEVLLVDTHTYARTRYSCKQDFFFPLVVGCNPHCSCVSAGRSKRYSRGGSSPHPLKGGALIPLSLYLQPVEYAIMPLLNWRALCAQALRLSDRANITQHAHTHTHTHTCTYTRANGSVVASSIAKIHRDQIAYSYYVVSNLLIMVAKSSQILLQLSDMQLISTTETGQVVTTPRSHLPLISYKGQEKQTGMSLRVGISSRSRSSSQGSAVVKQLSTRHQNRIFFIHHFCFSTCMDTCSF